MKRDAFGARADFPTADGPAVIYRLSALAQRGLAPGLDRLGLSRSDRKT